jgi:F-box/leucine-rich repeat protein 14
MGAIYEGIGGFLTDDVGHVVAIKYPPLDFSGFVFTDQEATQIASLTELTLLELPMMSNEMTNEGVKSIATLPKLEYLSMSSTENVDSVGFGYLSSLRTLKGLGLGLSPINDDGLQHIGELTQLEFLDLTGAKVGDRGVSFLQNLRALQSLALVSTRVTDLSMSVIGSLPALQKLDIRGCNVTDRGLAALGKSRSLRRLVAFPTDYGGGKITDAGLMHLKTVTTLEYVNVARNQVTPAGASALLSALPNCEVELTNTDEVDE